MKVTASVLAMFVLVAVSGAPAAMASVADSGANAPAAHHHHHHHHHRKHHGFDGGAAGADQAYEATIV
jgi:hypothetical protein